MGYRHLLTGLKIKIFQLSQQKEMLAFYVSANHRYVTFAYYYVADAWKLYTKTLLFQQRCGYWWPGLGA